MNIKPGKQGFHDLVKASLPEGSRDAYEEKVRELGSATEKVRGLVPKYFALLGLSAASSLDKKSVEASLFQKSGLNTSTLSDLSPHEIKSVLTEINRVQEEKSTLLRKKDQLSLENEKIVSEMEKLDQQFPQVSTWPVSLQRGIIVFLSILNIGNWASKWCSHYTKKNKTPPFLLRLLSRFSVWADRKIKYFKQSISFIETHQSVLSRLENNLHQMNDLNAKIDQWMERQELLKKYKKELEDANQELAVAKESVKKYLSVAGVTNLSNVLEFVDELFLLSTEPWPLDATSDIIRKIKTTYQTLEEFREELEIGKVLSHDPGPELVEKESAFRRFKEEYTELLKGCLTRIYERLLERGTYVLAESDLILGSSDIQNLTRESPLFEQMKNVLGHLNSFDKDCISCSEIMKISDPLFIQVKERIALLDQLIEIVDRMESRPTKMDLYKSLAQIQKLQPLLNQQEESFKRNASFTESDSSEGLSDSEDEEDVVTRKRELEAIKSLEDLTQPKPLFAVQGVKVLLQGLAQRCQHQLGSIQERHFKIYEESSLLRSELVKWIKAFEGMAGISKLEFVLKDLYRYQRELIAKTEKIEGLNKEIEGLESLIRKGAESAESQVISPLSNKIAQDSHLLKDKMVLITQLSDQIQAAEKELRGMIPEHQKGHLAVIEANKEALEKLEFERDQLKDQIEVNQSILDQETQRLEGFQRSQQTLVDELGSKEEFLLQLMEDLSDSIKLIKQQCGEFQILLFQNDVELLTNEISLRLTRISPLSQEENQRIALALLLESQSRLSPYVEQIQNRGRLKDEQQLLQEEIDTLTFNPQRIEDLASELQLIKEEIPLVKQEIETYLEQIQQYSESIRDLNARIGKLTLEEGVTGEALVQTKGAYLLIKKEAEEFKVQKEIRLEKLIQAGLKIEAELKALGEAELEGRDRLEDLKTQKQQCDLMLQQLTEALSRLIQRSGSKDIALIKERLQSLQRSD